MHRVELKDEDISTVKFQLRYVPNAPCGVESLQGLQL